MAKARKTKPRERLVRWRVSLIKGTPAKFIDYVEAPDAKTAEDIAAKEHRIPDNVARSACCDPRGRISRPAPLGRARR